MWATTCGLHIDCDSPALFAVRAFLLASTAAATPPVVQHSVMALSANGRLSQCNVVAAVHFVCLHSDADSSRTCFLHHRHSPQVRLPGLPGLLLLWSLLRPVLIRQRPLLFRLRLLGLRLLQWRPRRLIGPPTPLRPLLPQALVLLEGSLCFQLHEIAAAGFSGRCLWRLALEAARRGCRCCGQLLLVRSAAAAAVAVTASQEARPGAGGPQW